MNSASDLLYAIFEEHLYSALVEEESTDEFITRVVNDYLDRITTHASIPSVYSKTIAADLREEVLEMLRKKIYGHYNLSAFRKAQGILPGSENKAPSRGRRKS